MRRKAQIQMSENVIILFLFFILLAFGVVFYTKVQTAKVQQEVQQDIQGRALQIAQKIAFLPEIQCSKDNVVTSDCYDLYSLIAMDSITKRNDGFLSDYYYNTLGRSVISILRIFPDNLDPLVIYNDSLDNYTSINTAHIPILVCNFTASAAQDDCSFSVLKAEVYN